MPPKSKNTKGLIGEDEKSPPGPNRDFLLLPLNKVPIPNENDNLRLISIFVSGKLSSGPEQKKKHLQRAQALKEAITAQETQLEAISASEKGHASPHSGGTHNKEKVRGHSASNLRNANSIVPNNGILQYPPLKNGNILSPIGTYTDFEIQINDGMTDHISSLKSTSKTAIHQHTVIPSKPFFTLQVPGHEDVVTGGLPTQEMTPVYQVALQSTLADMGMTFDEFIQMSVVQSRVVPQGSRQPTQHSASNSKRDAAAAAALLQQQRLEENKQPPNTIRVLPTCEVVDDKDGMFKIEMYRGIIPISTAAVDQFLSKSFKFGVHAIPIHNPRQGGKGNVTFATDVDVKDTGSGQSNPVAPTVAKKIGSFKKRGGAESHTHDQINDTMLSRGHAASGVTGPYGIITSAPPPNPSTIPLSQAMSLLEHEFDLYGVFKDSTVDRIDLVVSDDEKYRSTEVEISNDGEENYDDLSPNGENTLDSHLYTSATKPSELNKSQSRRARRLHVNAYAIVPGFDSLTISIVCHRPIFSPVDLRRFIPIIIEVNEVNNLPPLQTSDLRHTMNPRMDEMTFASNYHKTATVCAPFDTDNFARLGGPRFDGVFVQYKLLGGENSENLTVVTTKRHQHDRDISFYSRKIVFLYKYPQQQLMEFFFFKGLTFEIHDRDEIKQKGSSDESQVQEKLITPAAAYGVVEIPLREALIADNGTSRSRFVVNHQVTPTRDIGSGVSYSADYLSNGTTLRAKVHLLAPLPVAKYTIPKDLVSSFISNSPNSVFYNKYHLSRAVFVFPYRCKNIKTILQVMMGSIIQLPKASGSTAAVVEMALEPPPEPPLVVEKVVPVVNLKKSDRNPTRVVEIPPKEEPITKPIDEDLPRVVDEVLFTVPEGISGFEIMDDDIRMVCLEGYVHVLHSIVEIVTRVLGESADKDPSIHIMFNTDLKFPQRWYHEWPPLVRPTPELEAKYGSTTDFGVFSDVVREEKKAGYEMDISSEPKDNECSPTPPQLKEKMISTTTEKKKQLSKSAQRAAEAKAKQEAELMIAAEKAREAQEEKERLEKEKKERLMTDGVSINVNNDLDGGGVGGRIRRFRITKPIRELYKHQRNFIKQSNARDTLRCIQKLVNLRDAPNMVCAIDHDFFPTAAEIIALDRVYGGTLEVFDICGSEEYFSFVSGDLFKVEDVVKESSMKQIEEIVHRSLCRPKSTEEILESGLELSNIGRIFNFIAIPANADQRAQIPKLNENIFPRFQFKNYMMLCKNEPSNNTSSDFTGGNIPLVCCYTVSPPTQLIRYFINAQVVGAFRKINDTTLTPVLFVLGFETVSKNSSDHKNPTYEEVIRQRAMRVHPKHYKRIIAQKNAHYIATHGGSDSEDKRRPGIEDSDEEDKEDFVDPPPSYTDTNDNNNDAGYDGTSAGINKISVIDNYVLLNKDVKATMNKYNRSIRDVKKTSDTDTQEEYQLLWDLYNAQSSRLSKLNDSVSKVRAFHDSHFVTGNRENTVQINPKAAYAKTDRIELDEFMKTLDSCEKSEKRKIQQSHNHSQHKLSLPPMKFHHKKEILEKTTDCYSDDDLRILTTAAAEAKEQQERNKREKEQWLSKVKVDNVHFSVPTKQSRDKVPCALNKYQSMLNDPPKKKTIKMSYAPPPPVNALGGATVIPNERIEPNDSKHPDISQFYYANNTIKSVKKRAVITDEEKQSPIWGKLS